MDDSTGRFEVPLSGLTVLLVVGTLPVLLAGEEWQSLRSRVSRSLESDSGRRVWVTRKTRPFTSDGSPVSEDRKGAYDSAANGRSGGR
jgi:hypothetical protein